VRRAARLAGGGILIHPETGGADVTRATLGGDGRDAPLLRVPQDVHPRSARHEDAVRVRRVVPGDA
jgi:hypothetical protein